MSDTETESDDAPKWHCRVCDKAFTDTLVALDHRIANEDAKIYPIYRTEVDDG